MSWWVKPSAAWSKTKSFCNRNSPRRLSSSVTSCKTSYGQVTIPFKPIIFHFWIIPSFYDMKGSMEIRRPCFLWLVDKRRTLSSSQMEAGSSHQIITSIPEEGAAFDSPALFDSFEEVELHPLDRQRTIKISSKRSRDGENTRVRSK